MLAPTPNALPQASPLHAGRTARPPRCRGGPRAPQRQSHRTRAAPSESAAAEAEQLVTAQAERLRPVFAVVDETTKQNLSRVLTAFRDARVGSHMFAGASSQPPPSSPRHAVFSCRLVDSTLHCMTHVPTIMLPCNSNRLHRLRPRGRGALGVGLALRLSGGRACCPGAPSVLQWHTHHRVCSLRHPASWRRAPGVGRAPV